MTEKMKAFIKARYDFIAYLVFGGLTTVVNYLVYLPCFNLLGLSATASNLVAWVASVGFAFLTNKPFVFKSHDWSANVVWRELTRFVGCRMVSGGLETLSLTITVDLLQLSGNWMKLAISVLVILINYVGSKLLVFRAKRGK